MLRLLRDRLIHLVPMLLGITVLAFVLSCLAPSDPALLELTEMGVAPNQETLEQTRAEMGLDQPIVIQYVNWLGRIFQGDFGESYHYDRPVLSIVLERLPATLELAACSIILALFLSVPLALLCALHNNRITDRIIRVLSICSFSMPTFWLALVLMYVFAYRLDWLPAFSLGNSPVSLILPATTLAVSMVGKYVRQMRTALLEEWSKPYVQGERARGIGDLRILLHHVLPNVAVPLLTVVGLSVGALLGGASVVEYIFSWHGLGEMAIDAIAKRDYPLIQGYVIWMALIYVLVNLATDVFYERTNKEISLTSGNVA